MNPTRSETPRSMIHIYHDLGVYASTPQILMLQLIPHSVCPRTSVCGCNINPSTAYRNNLVPNTSSN
ncbi:hypothetical protein WG66_002313 [Moniliophthora roreri]|nr:hypothetical protein WG66_002313 [Moniliophthora roreri]